MASSNDEQNVRVSTNNVNINGAKNNGASNTDLNSSDDHDEHEEHVIFFTNFYVCKRVVLN